MGRILVIGGTGNIGREVVGQLAERGAQVRALVRRPEKARMPQQVEVAGGDLTDPGSLAGALREIETVFMVWTAPPDAVAAALEEITKQARRIVFITAPLKTPHPFFQQPNGARALAERIEGLIESSGVDWTFLRCGMLASNGLFWWAPKIRAGEAVRWPYLEVATAPVDERDIAAVAVRALTEDGHAGAEYVLTGPQSLTQREQVSAIGQAIGRALLIEEITPDEAREELVDARMPLPVVNMLLNAWAAGAGIPAHVTSTVAEVTGRPARTYLEWAADHASEFYCQPPPSAP